MPRHTKSTDPWRLGARIRYWYDSIIIFEFANDPFTCIQALWLKAKLIAWVMSVTGLGKVVSDQNPLPCN